MAKLSYERPVVAEMGSFGRLTRQWKEGRRFDHRWHGWRRRHWCD